MSIPSPFVPLAAPGMVALGLKWMWNPASPFYVKPRLSWDLLDWGVKFWQGGGPGRRPPAPPPPARAGRRPRGGSARRAAGRGPRPGGAHGRRRRRLLSDGLPPRAGSLRDAVA